MAARPGLDARGLDDGPDIALDLSVSDCGSGNLKDSANSSSQEQIQLEEQGEEAIYFALFKHDDQQRVFVLPWLRTHWSPASKSVEAITP